MRKLKVNGEYLTQLEHADLKELGFDEQALEEYANDDYTYWINESKTEITKLLTIQEYICTRSIKDFRK